MSQYEITVVEEISPLPEEDWNRLVGAESPFLEHGFMAALEESRCLEPHTGWAPRIFLAREKGRLVGAAPFYLKEHSAGEFVFDWAWADASHRAGIPYYPKGIVAVPFTPVTGARILAEPGHDQADAIRRALLEAVLDFADQEELSSVHFNFILPSERPLFEDLGLPLRLGIQYHWRNQDFQNFDDFLARFRSKQRANIRRERRELQQEGIQTRILQGDQIELEDMALIFHFYRDTIQKFFYGRQYLNQDFFLRLHRTLRERLHLVFISKEGASQPFGAAFNLFKGERLYGRYWGASEDVRFAHFETCIYTPVEWAIEKGVQAFEPGAGGDHKYDRGFEPTLTYSAHYLRHPALRRGVTEHLRQERIHIKEQLRLLEEASPLKKKSAL